MNRPHVVVPHVASRRSGGATNLASLRDLEESQWFQENKSRLAKGLGILAATLLCVAVVLAYSRHQTNVARDALQQGIAAVHGGKFAEAIPLLERAERQFGGADSAYLATFYLNEAYTRAGKPEEAVKSAAALNSRTFAPGENYLPQAVLLSQGRNAEKSNDMSIARKAYEEASAIDGPFTSEALLALARVADLTEDSAVATAAREKFLTSHPNSPLADVLRQKLGK